MVLLVVVLCGAHTRLPVVLELMQASCGDHGLRSGELGLAIPLLQGFPKPMGHLFGLFRRKEESRG